MFGACFAVDQTFLPRFFSSRADLYSPQAFVSQAYTLLAVRLCGVDGGWDAAGEVLGVDTCPLVLYRAQEAASSALEAAASIRSLGDEPLLHAEAVSGLCVGCAVVCVALFRDESTYTVCLAMNSVLFSTLLFAGGCKLLGGSGAGAAAATRRLGLAPEQQRAAALRAALDASPPEDEDALLRAAVAAVARLLPRAAAAALVLLPHAAGGGAGAGAVATCGAVGASRAALSAALAAATQRQASSQSSPANTAPPHAAHAPSPPSLRHRGTQSAPAPSHGACCSGTAAAAGRAPVWLSDAGPRGAAARPDWAAAKGAAAGAGVDCVVRARNRFAHRCAEQFIPRENILQVHFPYFSVASIPRSPFPWWRPPPPPVWATCSSWLLSSRARPGGPPGGAALHASARPLLLPPRHLRRPRSPHSPPLRP